MEILLILIASISPIVAGCFALRSNNLTHRASEAVACLGTSTRELRRIRGLCKATEQRNDELTANTIDLQNELNIAIGRLEHLDRILKTKTKANRIANDKVSSLHDRIDHYAKADVAHSDHELHLRGVITNLRSELARKGASLVMKNEVIRKLRKELEAVSKRLPPVSRGDF